MRKNVRKQYSKCEHRNYKKIYMHGYKSEPILKCKDCGRIIKKYEIKTRRNYEI